MLHLRIFVPAELTEAVLAVLAEDPAVSSLALVRGASVHPAGALARIFHGSAVSGEAAL